MMKLRPLERLAKFEVRDAAGMATDGADGDPADAVVPVGELIEFTFSSEEPYDRGWGIEILGHGFGECDLAWMASGRAPLLVDHDNAVDSQVGIVERAWIENGRGKAVARLGKTDRARDILARIKDGQLANVSVGYRIIEMVLQQQTTDGDVYRVTNWKPLEASLVTIPADPTVGIGRASGVGDENTILIRRTETMTPEVKIPEKAAVNTDDLIKAERQRIADIGTIGARFNMADMAQKAIGQGLSVDQFRSDVLTRLGDGANDVLAAQNSIGLTKKQAQDFSFMKVIRALANPRERRFQEEARFEFEASAAFAERTGQAAKGILVPSEVASAEPTAELKRALLPYMKRDLTVGTAANAGYLVSTDTMTGSFIELLRASMVLDAAGVVTLGNLTGNIAIPRQTGAATAYWITTEGGSPTESQQSVGQVNMSPKTVGAFTDITRQFMLQSSVDAEAFVRADFARIMGLKIDAAGLLGAGAAGEPQGIKNTTGIGTQSIASSGDPTFAEVVAMEGTVDAANARAGSLCYIAHPTMVAKMKVKSVVSGQAIFVWGQDDRVNSYRGLRTTQIGATNLYFGNWADLVMGMWGGLDVTVDPFTQSTAGTVRIVALQSVDFGVRHVESFVLGS